MKNILLLLVVLLLAGCTKKSLDTPFLDKVATPNAAVVRGTSGTKTSYQDSALTKSFSKFLIKFSTDSVFQMKHVQLPLKCKHAGYGGDADSTFTISRASYKCYDLVNFKPDDNGNKMFSDIKLIDKDHIKVTVQKEDTGINIEFYFIAKNNDDWMLMEMVDSST
jgi:hypothetical protein